MSKDVWVRYTRPEDADELLDWATRAKDINLADPEILNYKRISFLCAHRDGKNIVYMPVQVTLTLESLCPNPEASELEMAQALKALIQRAVSMAEEQEIREIYFVCKDERVVKLAERHGFTEILWKVLSLDIRDLEKKVPVAEAELAAT